MAPPNLDSKPNEGDRAIGEEEGPRQGLTRLEEVVEWVANRLH